MHNLLNDALLGILAPEGPSLVTLPGLLGRLSKGEVMAYTGLRPHQEDPWRVFLVQLAASILARFPRESPPTEENYWREGLLDLSGGQTSAWELVVEDVTKPAFLQHPWKSKEEIKDFKPKDPKATTPDELDVLVTAKNHDVKASRIRDDQTEAWIYALLCYQTLSGFLGAGNYGIIRMNGGHASRPIISLASSLAPSVRFQEEVNIVRQMRDSILNGGFGYRPKGVVLTWLQPWDRTGHQYTLSQLEPFFIEAARPLRMVHAGDGSLRALGATSKARQIGPKSLDNGDVGDPWIPLNVGDKKKGRSALSVSNSGFPPKLLTSLIFEQDYELTLLQKPRPGSGPAWFVATVLARGQGKTEGFHSAVIPIPEKARLKLLSENTRQGLGAFGRALLKDAATVQLALGSALMALVEGGPEKTDYGKGTAKAWSSAVAENFSRLWEDRYFPFLWRRADEEEDSLQTAWQKELVESAFQVLHNSAAALPIPSSRRYRALVRARGFLAGILRKKEILPKSPHPETMEEAE
jgi:CRISPR system Cascade subunit CasA